MSLSFPGVVGDAVVLTWSSECVDGDDLYLSLWLDLRGIHMVLAVG